MIINQSEKYLRLVKIHEEAANVVTNEYLVDCRCRKKFKFLIQVFKITIVMLLWFQGPHHEELICGFPSIHPFSATYQRSGCGGSRLSTGCSFQFLLGEHKALQGPGM